MVLNNAFPNGEPIDVSGHLLLMNLCLELDLCRRRIPRTSITAIQAVKSYSATTFSKRAGAYKAKIFTVVTGL